MGKVAIVGMTRGHIDLQVGDKRIKVPGEAFLPGAGSPDFVVYAGNQMRFDPPDDDRVLTSEEKRQVVDALLSAAKQVNLNIEVEDL